MEYLKSSKLSFISFVSLVRRIKLPGNYFRRFSVPAYTR